jgi:hypothetical protein
MQQEQARRQQEELAEKQKQLMFSQYENAMRGNRMIAEDLARQQQRMPQAVPDTGKASRLDEVCFLFLSQF